MKTIKKAQAGKKVVTKPVRKKPITPVDDYKNMVDPATGKKGTMGGEGTTPPFSKGEKRAVPDPMEMARKNAMKKKAKNGTSLGMKSVKAGFDKNPGVTRADVITAAKGKAQNGKKMTKINKLVPSTSQIKANVMPPKTKTKNINAFQGKKGMLAKSGTSMKKCKYGCK
jgi:hypothetical protein